MDNQHSSTAGGVSYTHLSESEREAVFAGLVAGNSNAMIAGMIGRHRSTIARERKRNLSVVNRYRYSPLEAQRKYRRRLTRARRRTPLKCREIQDYVERCLWKRWSPQIIAGRLRIDHPELCTNHESIYLYIYRHRRELTHLLAHSHKRRRRRSPRSRRTTEWGSRPSIELRDPRVERRDEPGHWELDTMVCRSTTTAIAVAYERATRLVRLRLLKRKTAQQFAHAICWALGTLPDSMRKTLTYDNGAENTKHETINAKLGTTSYFCHPYASWEKPGVEQVIGLLRAFIPRRTRLEHLSKDQLRYYQNLLNDRPRVCLGFHTPNERYREVALPR